MRVCREMEPDAETRAKIEAKVAEIREMFLPEYQQENIDAYTKPRVCFRCQKLYWAVNAQIGFIIGTTAVLRH